MVVEVSLDLLCRGLFERFALVVELSDGRGGGKIPVHLVADLLKKRFDSFVQLVLCATCEKALTLFGLKVDQGLDLPLPGEDKGFPDPGVSVESLLDDLRIDILTVPSEDKVLRAPRMKR